jgi:DNA-binding beta-propeller fold protein YncE
VRAWHWAFYSVDAVCITDERTRVFVAGGHEGALAIDGVSDRLRGVWTDECYPIGLFADSAHGKLYCLSEYPQLVSVIDPSTNSLLNTISISGYLEAIAFNTVDHKAYVSGSTVDEDPGTIVVLDAVGDTVLTELDLARAQDFLAFDADDDLLYAADHSSHWILEIDGKTDRVVDSCYVVERPVGVLYNGAQHRLYSFGAQGELTAITPRVHGQNKEFTVGAGLQLAVLDASGTRLFGGNPDNDELYVVDCVAESLVEVMPVPVPPVAFSYDQFHDRLYCAYGEAGSGISVIDCSQRIVRAIVPVDARSLYWDSGTDAVYCLNDSSVTVVDGQTHRVVATIKMDWPLGVASAPGWPRVYVADYDEPYLTVIRTDTGPQVRESADAQATLVRGRLNWTGTLAVMFDMGGRRVLDVHRGANDVSRLRPGVYFVRENGVRRGTYARKVVVTR